MGGNSPTKTALKRFRALERVKYRNGGRSPRDGDGLGCGVAVALPIPGPMGPGEYRYLTRAGAEYAVGLSVGVFFTPTGCLTASAGRGAAPHGFNLATEAK